MLIRNLIFLYHVIVASENLLRVAIACTTECRLKAYFERHLGEERDHAKWLAEDLTSVGVDVTQTQPPRIALQMVGSIYYLIFHADPAALLGYMLVLEKCPMKEEQLKVLEKRYPAALLRTAQHHLKHDPNHLKDLLVVISNEAITPRRANLIIRVARMTQFYLHEASMEFSRGEMAA